MSGPVGGPKIEIDPARAAESNTATILGVLTVFHAIALIFVSLRVYARAFVIKTFGTDDVFIVLCALCAIGGWSVFIFQAGHGLGKHQETISKEDMLVFQHAGFWQSIISATWALGFLKISIGFNLLRLSSGGWYRWCLWATIIFVCCYTFMAMMTFLLYCEPMEGYWNNSVNPKCYSISLFVTFALINTSFNIFTDVLFATFPIPIIWTLKMKRKLKIYLVVILSLGYFAVAMGIVKSIYQIAFAREPDKTFNQSIQFWGFLQLQLGIIAACATSLKPLFSRILKLSTNEQYYGTPGAQYGYGSRSRGRRTTGAFTGNGNGTGTGTGTRNTRKGGASSSTANDYELETGVRGSSPDDGCSGDLSNAKDGRYSNGMSFYKHHSDGSGSEEMILGATAGAAVLSQPPHALTADEAARGIVRTTEVRVVVR
ncbi:hypothetical protein C7999DRAFT_18479 [Corynascus novoguineensis]|uniref:Rhodopsin domain-containing protein n=1 Tax=Corynascus novoguineensis TaxID=1126955 RepID=A0AAN7HK72_9PEZI|nr:hypothetical protein C7999DRAFT_18479 [Corynascus novoguineensis]